MRDLTSATRRLPALLMGLILAGLAACGGGGGGLPLPGGDPGYLDGLVGRVLLPDYDVGRIVEQEPNDTAGEGFRMPPLWPRCALQVTGELGATAAHRGRADPADVLLLSPLTDQSVDLRLEFLVDDPITSSANDFRVAVTHRATGAVLASTGAGFPRSLSFEAAADDLYEIVLSADFGHGWYVLDILGHDRPDAQPSAKMQVSAPVPAAPRRVAARRSAGARHEPCAAGHVLVRFVDGCDPMAACVGAGLKLGRRTGSGSYCVHVPPLDYAADVESLCRRLRQRSDVTWAEPDWVVRSLGQPSASEGNRQWNLRAVGATAAWEIVTGDADVVVAVVDGGIADHPDLDGRTVDGYDFVSSAETAADGDGRDADPADPGDEAGSSGLSVWHGTHVASIIAGDGGVRGVAPGCRVMMLRALGVGGGLVSDAADAIRFAAGLTSAGGRTLSAPVRIVNLSIGLDQDSAELRSACEDAASRGCFLVAAAGNDGGPVLYPAAYDSTFAVGAVDGLLLTTGYSNFGEEVDLAAPGGGSVVDQWDDGWPDGVLGAVRDETLDPPVWSHGYLVGTSQAAPHVAGAAALLLSLDPTLAAADLADILRASAVDLGLPGNDVAYGAGLLQVHEAVKRVLARNGTPLSTPPRLLLPTGTLQFEGLRTSLEIPLFNGGGGRAEVLSVVGVTDDGVGWLTAGLQAAPSSSSPVNQRAVRVIVNRDPLSQEAGRYSGTLVFNGRQGVEASIRIVAYVGQRTRAGQTLSVVAMEDGTGIARSLTFASPEFGYRYWIRNLRPSFYRLQAGEDLDRDGFFCENGDACGWLGGPTEMEAAVVEVVASAPAIRGLAIDLMPPP